MKEITPIARLVEFMLADGAAHEAIVQAVAAAEVVLHSKLPNVHNSRGTRLPNDWAPSPACVTYAKGRGMPADRIAREAEKFRNFWTAKAGAGATKRDWDATWRNWIINAVERRHDASGGRRAVAASGRTPTGADAVLAGMGRLARRRAQDRNAARPHRGVLAGSADTAEAPDAD